MWSYDRVIIWSYDYANMWSYDPVIIWSCDHMIMWSLDHVIICSCDHMMNIWSYFFFPSVTQATRSKACYVATACAGSRHQSGAQIALILSSNSSDLFDDKCQTFTLYDRTLLKKILQNASLFISLATHFTSSTLKLEMFTYSQNPKYRMIYS